MWLAAQLCAKDKLPAAQLTRMAQKAEAAD
jgi:hypothetical protein